MNCKFFPTFFITLFSISFSAFCQKTYSIPKEYKILKDYNNKDIRFDADFDKDGTNDVVVVCVNKTDDSRNVLVFLSSRYFTEEIYFWFPWNHEYYNFEFENNKFVTSGTSGNQTVESLTLKYYPDIENMRLVHFNSKSFGNSTSINLLSNQYTVDINRKKTSFNLVTLSNIEVFLEYYETNGW
jgi:hypothetical protein